MDMMARLRRVLPIGWFADADPVLDTVLAGLAAVWTVIQSQIDETRSQARLLSASGSWLDGKVADFLGAAFRRRASEADAAFAARAALEIVRPRATRPALARLLQDEGSPSFTIFEPSRAADTGGLDTPSMGYGVAGAWGSLLTPFQVFIDAQRPLAGTVPNNGGWDGGLGYDVGGGGWSSLDSLRGGVSDTELYAAITNVMPVGVTAWTRLK